jgi:hypothetical protein
VNVGVKCVNCEVQIERPAVNSKSIAVSPDDNVHLNCVYDEQITSITFPWTCYEYVVILGIDNLTPWNLVRLENLTPGRLVKKPSALYGPPKVHYLSPLRFLSGV